MPQKRRSSQSPHKKTAGTPPRRSVATRVVRLLRRAVLWGLALVLLAVLAGRIVNPPVTPYMAAEAYRLGGVARDWVPMDRIAPAMARAAVAAEDANFCLHWGFDLDAIRVAIADGSRRGASTISQQTVKNVYLWHGRNWLRKALETALTPVVEAAWPKRRILEVYLNVAEFAEGVFGVEAAARHHFGVSAADLDPRQAALLAAVLPSPKTRSAAQPSDFVQRRARAIRDGAETIRADGRAACFES
ncbi:monofunctional biosynthetic peptidoglycan transglycosylase [Rhodosalinus sp. 5P4]|uniref:monofunctional biosynthetic peptidoglycan transglycosylase n=1 Tax=Rhodosalinus sp. 5P4 TaxID=3239196 RepID=UPI00352459B1